jgi:hypothetical protein
MSLILTKCVEFSDDRKEFVASENGKTFRLDNSSGAIVRKVKVDKCIVQKLGEGRCDYLMNIDDKKIVYFIELKGGDLRKALKQISDTIEYLKSEFTNFIFEARIVGSGNVPKLKTITAYKNLAKLVLPTNGKIIYRTNKFHTESI